MSSPFLCCFQLSGLIFLKVQLWWSLTTFKSEVFSFSASWRFLHFWYLLRLTSHVSCLSIQFTTPWIFKIQFTFECWKLQIRFSCLDSYGWNMFKPNMDFYFLPLLITKTINFILQSSRSGMMQPSVWFLKQSWCLSWSHAHS